MVRAMQITSAGTAERWPQEAWVPLLAGLFWLWTAPTHGFAGFLVALLPGVVLLGAGFSMLALAGDRRAAHWTAAGGVLGVLFALPGLFVLGFWTGLLLIAASLAAFVAGGWHSVKLEMPIEGIPETQLTVALAAQVAVDEALAAEMVASTPMPSPASAVKIAGDLNAAAELYAAHGWLEDPESFHVEPPALDAPQITRRTHRSHAYEHLSFESGYEPHAEEPGRERWLGYESNRTAHAWVLRHEGRDRPWLVCIHGYMMGWSLADLGLFDPAVFHEKLGLNMIVPVLPLHGHRSTGRRSGKGFFGADMLNMVHAEAQAMWDMRRCLSWVRAQTAQPVGVYGVSLGGYNAALLASLDAELACVVAGIAVADMPRIVHRMGPPISVRTANQAGLDESRMREVARVVSPLAMQPKVPHAHRHLFAAVGDRIVIPDHQRDLWRHWEEPEIVWYQGGHCTFLAHPAVARMQREAFASAGLTSD